ncbi:antigen 5 like allergen Cul n 1-like [Teleopsis dalmanni]|uniref:antigen 5 like allergen Cul n 1-like n=1 Tax=Teleopsis dalmanni TaxID=139649 RepID=UPI0018CC87B0|nr:antigen 5 like allergen Cul n 1-like [Teleopsis dalmanni]
MYLLLSLIVIFGAHNALGEEENYCEIYHCGETHIACNNDGNLSPDCPLGTAIVNMTHHEQFILDLHNAVRNKYAGGVPPLPVAGRMAQMVWCEELAALAELNVKKCILEPDACHSTMRARYSGQNSGMTIYKTSQTITTLAWLIENRFDTWVREGEWVTMQQIKKYPDIEPALPIGHFTLIINEKNTHVGCAAVRYKEEASRIFLFTCNYAAGNIIGKPVYTESNVPGQECETDTSIQYPNLCEIDEAYDNTQ